MNQFLDAALKYIALGWQIFPLAPGQKTPITAHGVKDATADPEQIKKWWTKWPNANIAVACGARSGVHVVDVDVAVSGDVNGLKSLEEFPTLPDTIRQDTPRGGFHAFYRTNDPPANRNSFRPGIDIRGDGYYVVLTPSLHPNGGKYVWRPGCSPWDRKLAEFPDFMRPTTHAPWANTGPSTPIPPGFSAHPPGDADTLRRASLYLAKIDPAVQGQDGHGSLLWAAQCMVGGWGLSDSQALDLLVREYNPLCSPPWDMSNKADAKDFVRKITEARKNPPRSKPHLWLLNDPEYAPVDPAALADAIDVESLIAEAHPRPKIKRISSSLTELKFLCAPTGLLGDICSWINSVAMKEQPFLTLACSLTFLGALFGRKVRDKLGGRTNLYCMGVAESSAGKNNAPHQIRRLCAVAGAMHLLAGDDIASDTSIESRMAREPASIFLLDEIGHLLAYIKSGVSTHHARVISILMRFYSSANSIYKGREYAEEENQRTIIQPCCCVYGTSEIRRFIGAITPEQLTDGWLSRCLVFHTVDKPPKTWKEEEEVPELIVQQVHAWAVREIKQELDDQSLDPFVTQFGDAQPPQQIIVPTEPSAEQLFRAFDSQSEKQGTEWPAVSRLWAKAEENARRIALIVASGERFDNPVITLPIADYSTRLIQYLLLDFSKVFVPEIVSSVVEAEKRQIIVVIEQYGIGGCIQRDLTRGTPKLDILQRKRLVADLEEAAEVVRAVKPGRKSDWYWTAENHLSYLQQGGE